MTTPVSYTLGLDVGIASVGWCVLGAERIIDLGVRCFDKAENEKGESKGIEWRSIKTQRRRLQRRAGRLLRLRRLCLANGIVPTSDSSHFCSTGDATPWDLRVEALDRLLTPLELGIVVYHIVKHRGFLSTRKAELKDDKKEAGKLSAGVSRTKELLLAGGWRTPGELAARDPSFAEGKRNKQGQYKNTFDRNLLLDELKQIFTKQRSFNSPFVSPEFEEKVVAIFEQQKPAITGAQMLALIGRCTFEKSEYRAPKASWTAERFVWMTKLNNLRIVENGARRELTEAEREAIITLPYELKDVKYKSVRTKLKKLTGFSDSARFVGLTYSADKDPEVASFASLKGWHTLKMALENAGLSSLWVELSTNSERLDQLALALSLYKTDEEIRENLVKQGFTAEAIEALLDVSFSGFIQLSTKALTRIVPFMEAGQRYDEACISAGYHHSQVRPEARQKLLPVIPREQIRNPVVSRALNQTRKIVNALVRKYGSPAAVHIELARDLSKPFDERRDIKKAQDKFQQDKERSKNDFIEKFGVDPNPKNQDLLKYRLYEDQQGKCAYSLAALDVARLFEKGYAEIDHILPYSRSFDDSQNNKVLVLTTENRNKNNSTPFEYLGGDEESTRWHEFQSWVLGNRTFRAAKRERLLRRSFDEREASEFKERNLNDTRYLARFLKNFIEENLSLKGDDQGKVVCVNGQFTAFLRARWGLVKVRAQSDKHHAMDAAVIAAANRSLIKRVSNFSRYGKIIQRSDGLFVARDTGEVLEGNPAELLNNRFPRPWEEFRDELLARLDEKPIEQLKQLDLKTYAEEQLRSVHPLFVSRAPKRRNKGAFHQETIRSAKQLDKGVSTVKTSLQSLTVSDLGQLVELEDPRNKPLYDALRSRMEQFKGDARKAFAEPFYKPNKKGESTALVRAVRVKRVQKGGLSVRHGIADQASMIRIDVFTKSKKFFAIPIYQSDRAATELPQHAVDAGKPRSSWTLIDDSFEFLFSLYPNDVVSLKKQDEEYLGYFAGLDVSTGAINILVHDRDKNCGKDGLHRSLGIRTAVGLEKFHVDPLGQLFRVKQESRHGLA